MKRTSLTLLSMLLCSTAQAAWLPSTSVTSPAFEATTVGPDTCAASAIPQIGNMTLKRVVSGPATFTDSLANVPPATPMTSPRLNNIPRGTYTVTVSWRDQAGNWSCPDAISLAARGQPAKGTAFGWLQLADEQRERWLAAR